jgi:hypothetical protein
VSANISVLNSIWSWVIPVALVYFVYLTWRPNKTLARLQLAHRGFRPFGISGLILGVLSMLLNDSGASMPAMMLAISLAYITYLAIGLEARSSPPTVDVTATAHEEDPAVEATAEPVS